MKKFFKYALTLVVALCFTASVNAATEQEVINYASKSFDINGNSVSVPASTVNILKSHLDSYELSSADGDKIINYIDKAVNVFRREKVTSATKLSKAGKEELLNLARSAASSLGFSSVNYNKNTEALNVVVTSTNKSLSIPTTLVVNGKVAPKRTGSDYTVYALASIIAIAVAAVCGLKKLRNND